jgi:hypothetical protein
LDILTHEAMLNLSILRSMRQKAPTWVLAVLYAFFLVTLVYACAWMEWEGWRDAKRMPCAWHRSGGDVCCVQRAWGL